MKPLFFIVGEAVVGSVGTEARGTNWIRGWGSVEMHANSIEATRYLNMELLSEHKKLLLREIAA